MILSAFGLIVLIFGNFEKGWQQATMGIDFGRKYIKVSVVTVTKPIETVLDRDSNRKTQNIMGFKDGFPVFAESAKNLLRRNPDCVVQNVEALLGRRFSDKSIIEYRQQYPHLNITENEATGGIFINFPKFNLRFTPVEVLSLWFTEIQRYTALFSGYEISDALICFSPTIDQARSNAVKAAAKLAKINLMEITDSSRTVATHYIVSRKQLLEETPTFVLFADVGSDNSVFTISKIGLEPGLKPNTTVASYNITGISYVKAGAGDIDGQITNFFIEDFKNKNQITKDLLGEHKVVLKFAEQAIVAKHVLTSSKEVRVMVEEAYQYINYQTSFNRTIMEDKCSHILAKIADAVNRVFVAAKITPDQLSDVIAMGGGCLIPSVQGVIQQITKLSPSRILNTDESIAGGSAILSAKAHKFFRVMEFKSPAYNYYPIGIETEVPVIDSEGNNVTRHHRELLYPYMSRQTAKKVFTLNNVSDDFTIRVSYGPFPDHLTVDELDSLDIMNIHVNGVKKVIADNAPNIPKHISIHFRIDINRLLNISKIEYMFEKNQTGNLFTKMGQAVMDLFKGPSNETETENPPADNGTEIDSPENKTDASNITESTPPKAVSAKQNISVPVPFTVELLYFNPPDPSEMTESATKLAQLYLSEKTRQDDIKSRSDLESAIFENLRSINEGGFKEYFTEEEYANYTQKSLELKETFEAEGHTYNASTSKSKLRELKAVASPAKNRIKETEEVNALSSKLTELINRTQGMVGGIFENSEIQKLINISIALDVLNKTLLIQSWLKEKSELQATLKPTDKSPALTSGQLRRKIRELEEAATTYYKALQEAINLVEKTKPKTSDPTVTKEEEGPPPPQPPPPPPPPSPPDVDSNETTTEPRVDL